MQHSVFKEVETGAIITTADPSNYTGDAYKFLGFAEEPKEDERWCEEHLCFKPCPVLKAAREARPKSDKQRIEQLERRVDELTSLVEALRGESS